MSELWYYHDQPVLGLTRDEITAEIWARLVRIASIPFLPLLAAPLGLGSRRSPKSAALVIGVCGLITYQHILLFGAKLAGSGVAPPWLTLGLPLFLFVLFGVFGFHLANTRPNYNPITALLDSVGNLIIALRPVALRERRIG